MRIRSVLAVLPLLVACVRSVDLGDRSDAATNDTPDIAPISDAPVSDGPSTDAPPSDAPSSDAPLTDAPPTVCQSCGGPSSPSCLYAAGCESPQRICATNTCGDAVAIQYCGCDGRTFVSGCLTPERPYRARGSCEDAAVTPTDAAMLAYCPEEVDHNTAMDPDLRYRRAAFAIPPDRGAAAPDGGAIMTFNGTWVGTRMLTTNIVLGCPSGDVRYACRADTVIQMMNGSTLFELVAGFSPDELTALTPGMPISVSVRATRWDGATQRGYDSELIVRRRSDSALMLAAVTGQFEQAGFDVPVVRAQDFCISRPEPICNRTLHAYSLRFGEVDGSVEVAPDLTATLAWRGARYTVRNRAAVSRVPGSGVECADAISPVVSFEIVRQP